VDRYPTARYALLELQPDTGRRHQIRRHLAHVSHPIVGDSTYGKSRHNRLFRELFGVGRLLLACVRLEFTHPVTGAPLAIDAGPGDGFSTLLEKLDWQPAAPSSHRGISPASP
jgi:tRNA pseudouridine65 synthase